VSELGRFQDAFAAALTGEFASLASWTRGEDAEARFSVYRNTVAKGCADALIAQFPTVTRVVGEPWMGQAGVLFARERPPTRPSLHEYGEAFADWLARFPPAADMPWLAGLARIDWAWRSACFAADQAPLPAEAFVRLAPEGYDAVTAELHPATAVLWFEDGTPDLWRALQGAAAPAQAELDLRPQGLLLARPRLEVEHRILGPGSFAFLDACAGGRSLAAAAQAALAAESGLQLSAIFAELIALGAFVRLTHLPARESVE
jgi:putative DNA-binding protein